MVPGPAASAVVNSASVTCCCPSTVIALDAKTGSYREGLDAPLCLAIQAVVSAHPKSVDGGAREQEHGNDAPGATAAVKRGPAGTPLGARQIPAS